MSVSSFKSRSPAKFVGDRVQESREVSGSVDLSWLDVVLCVGFVSCQDSL